MKLVQNLLAEGEMQSVPISSSLWLIGFFVIIQFFAAIKKNTYQAWEEYLVYLS